MHNDKGSFFQEDVTVLTTYEPNDSVKRHEEQTVMGPQGTVDEAAITARDLSASYPKRTWPVAGSQDRDPKETKNFENSAVRK